VEETDRERAVPPGLPLGPRVASLPASSARDLDPTFASRYECKYIVDAVRLPEIRTFLVPFTRPDGYASRHAGGRYPVCSLYLDSADLLLYRQTESGERDRFKLRVRTYSDDPEKLAYFEVKRKVSNIVHKRRVGLSREHAVAVLDQRPLDFAHALSPRDQADLAYFNHQVARIAARPVVRIKYTREAYQGLGNEPVRITIDTDLHHATTFGADLGHGPGRWSATPLGGAIVEVKFTERFPWWVQEFIRAFDLHQRGVPKYVLSVQHLLAGGHVPALNISGMTLPPGRG
jgi:hypothetical protein